VKKYRVRVNGVAYEVEVDLVQDDEAELPTGLPSQITEVSRSPALPPPVIPPRVSLPPTATGAPGQIVAPLTGAVHRIPVAEGQRVQRGDVMLEIDAMKMNTKIHAPSPATIVTIHVREGDNIAQGQTLISLKED
jgi:glutaconyl-CoA/methylmalonyl-CoA decarboxylase subunit gamma